MSMEALPLPIAKSKRLQVVARLAQLREQQQLIRLQQTHSHRKQQRDSLNQLQEYQDEYSRNGISLGKDDASVDATPSYSVSDLKNFSRFMNDLSVATQIQQQQLGAAEEVCQNNEAHWAQLHARHKRLQELVESNREQEQQQAETLADRENDDRWNALQQAQK